MNASIDTGSALWSAQAHMPSVLGRRLVIDRGEGTYVYTSDGRRLFDGTAGLWHANIGHGRARAGRGRRRQMRSWRPTTSSAATSNDRALELAERVAATAPIADAR